MAHDWHFQFRIHKGNVMMAEDRRKNERIQTHNLLYLCIKENDDLIQQGMGRTLNISEGGIRLETNFHIDSQKSVFLSIAFEDNIAELNGRIAYYIKKNDRYEFGIQFEDIDRAAAAILKQYIRVFKKENNL